MPNIYCFFLTEAMQSQDLKRYSSTENSKKSVLYTDVRVNAANLLEVTYGTLNFILLENVYNIHF